MGDHPPSVEVEEILSIEAAARAAALFDDPLDEAATRRFVADDRHHPLIGYVGEQPTGFVTAVELLHPDKPQPEMFLYELGVAEERRGQGVATALMQRLIDLCHERGCGEMFVLTDKGNIPAVATYRRAGGKPDASGLMFHWDWRPAAR